MPTPTWAARRAKVPAGRLARVPLGGLLLAMVVESAPAATFHEDVAPILRKRCQSCHRPDEIGPMPLLTYQQVRPWAKAIREAVVRRRMPPWFAESGSLEFENDPRLTAAEISAISEWVRAGAREGGPTMAPGEPASSRGGSDSEPDLRITMPTPVRVPARTELPYQLVILPAQFPEDRWVRAAEIRPGARSVVHHAVAYVREPGSAWLPDAPLGVPISRPAAESATTSDILAIYTPGQPAMRCPSGTAKKIPAGSAIVLELHYTPDGAERTDQTILGLAFSAAPVKRLLTLQLATTDIRIPPGEASHRVTVSGTLPNGAELISLFPHMHRRGKAFEYAIAGEGGRYETLLRVAPWDFHWQLNYRLARPRLLPKGTRLQVTAWYDNSPNNPRNPDSSAEVRYGPSSNEEMLVGFFDVAVPANVDKPAYFIR